MKAYIMGNYTEKAFQGFLKDPKKFSQLPGILRNLRGDFPCVPFGINTPIENISEDWKKSYSEEPYIVNDPHGNFINRI
mgnify:CR=1 FL=1